MPNSDRKILAFLAGFKKTTLVIIITSLMVASAAIMSFVSDTFSVYENGKKWLSGNVNGRFLLSAGVKSGESITFSYTLPDSGYYSLWNQNSEGVMIRLLPENPNSPSVKVYAREKPHQFKVWGNKSRVLEQMVILWSEKPNHPPKQGYRQWREFEEYMETHAYNWKMKKIAVQIL